MIINNRKGQLTSPDQLWKQSETLPDIVYQIKNCPFKLSFFFSGSNYQILDFGHTLF